MLKTRQINKLKKILAIIFIAMTVFSTAQPIFAVSSSGTGKWVAGQWGSEVFTTDTESPNGMLIRRLVNYTTGERLTVFCCEHGVDCVTGEIHTATHTVPTEAKMKELVKLLILDGTKNMEIML